MENFRNSATLERAEGLWHEGGTVVFQAKNIIYRLPPSILYGCSSFFRDMFEVPQPETRELYDRSPLVRMPDAAADVTPFVQAIFCPAVSPICLPETANIPLDLIIPILRLSTKYNVEFLRFHALRHLRSRIPTNWREFSSRPPDAWIKPQAALPLVPLPHLCNVTWLLPFVSYRAAVSEIGFHFSSTTTLQELLEKHSPSDLELSIAEERQLWRGRSSFLFESNNIRGRLLLPNEDDCVDYLCLKERIRLATNYMDCDLFVGPDWTITVDTMGTGQNIFCGYCEETIREDYEAWEQELWEKLPGIFGLAEWSVLLQMEGAEMEFSAKVARGAQPR